MSNPHLCTLSYAPGARVVVRDEEWLVRHVDPSSDGGYLLNCDGISDLVRGRTALFLTKLEGDDKITLLDPAKTELVADSSSHFNSTFLYLEAKLRQSTPNDDRIHLGHRGVMNLTPYQLDPALQALRHPASPEEENAYEALLSIPLSKKGKRQAGKQQEFQHVGMQKGIFSSPAAALESTRRRIRLLQGLWKLESFPDFTARTGLQAGKLPHSDSDSGNVIDTTALQKNLPAAVTAMRKFMIECQKSLAAEMKARLEKTLANLALLQGYQEEQLELRFEKSGLAEHLKREQRTQHIRKVFDEYRDWIRDTMTTEPEPFIQVLAAATKG